MQGQRARALTGRFFCSNKNCMKQKATSAEDRVVDAYYADVRDKTLLSKDLERELFAAYRTCATCSRAYTEDATQIRCPGCDAPRNMRARERLVEGSLRFVIKIAKDYARRTRGHSYDSAYLTDLISAGNLGLLIAIDRFDTTLGTRLLTFAVHWIREKIREQLDNDGTVRVPAYRQKELRSLRRWGLLPPNHPPLVSMEPLTSLETVRSDEATERDFINRYGGEAIHKALDDLEFRGRDRYVIAAYFGLKDSPRNLTQISNQLGLSAERVRIIKNQGLEKLSGYLQEVDIEGVSDIFE